jgi:AbrB family looped-hinge helix DNA binding protein
MNATATLSSRFRLSIPKAVREAHQWKAGQQFAFLPKDGGIMLVPIPQIEHLIGIVAGADATDYRDRPAREDRS